MVETSRWRRQDKEIGATAAACKVVQEKKAMIKLFEESEQGSLRFIHVHLPLYLLFPLLLPSLSLTA